MDDNDGREKMKQENERINKWMEEQFEKQKDDGVKMNRIHDSAPAAVAEPKVQQRESRQGEVMTNSSSSGQGRNHEASEKRNRTASQQHPLIQYCDECVCSRACSGLCTVFVSVSVFSSIVFVASVRAILSLRVVMHRFKKRRDFRFS